MATHDFKYNNVPLFARKLGNINTSMYAATKRRMLIKFSLRDCICIQIIKQCTCIYDISNLIVSVKGCF